MMLSIKKTGYQIFLLYFFSAYSFSNQKLDDQYHRYLKSYLFARHLGPSNRLISVNSNNQDLVWNKQKNKVLAVTWASEYIFEKFIKNSDLSPRDESILMWVTLAPEVKRFCRQYTTLNPHNNKEALELRIKQYLGLSPIKQYDLFIEIWVSPDYLFRPCVDPEINDSVCNWNFNNNPVIKNAENYRNLFFSISNMTTSNHIPWTGFGYTYDWGSSKSAVGASEFILVPGTFYEIKKTFSTSDYCNLDNQ